MLKEKVWTQETFINTERGFVTYSFQRFHPIGPGPGPALIRQLRRM
jgi:hypothetical protein